MAAMISLALILIGFSVVSALLLTVTHFRAANYSEQPFARSMGLLLLAALAGLQIAHWGWLYIDQPWIDTALYRMLLFTVAPAFWAFSQPLLKVQAFAGFHSRPLLHALPIAFAPWLVGDVAMPLAFVVGAGYLVSLGRDIHHLRMQRAEYAKEIALLGTIFVIAVGVALLGILQTQLPDKLFFILYAIAIGLSFLLVQAALGLRPQLSVEVTEAAKAAYGNSTLTRVDCPTMLDRLATLMDAERIYENPDLSLAGLAQRLGLTPHQLSELVNVHLGKGFSRYLREIRVAAAGRMLCAQPSASVLSIGLSVGFSAQSNFYEAFREIEGMTPGQYRKLRLNGGLRP
jgi:AraC-like DNA-binding protein